MAPLVRTTTSITVLRAGAKINSIPGEATAFVVRFAVASVSLWLLSHLYLYGPFYVFAQLCFGVGVFLSLSVCVGVAGGSLSVASFLSLLLHGYGRRRRIIF